MNEKLVIKSQIDAYTKKDGTFVAAHTDKRQAAKPKQVHSDSAFDQIKAAGGSRPSTSSVGINYYHNGKPKSLPHKDAPDGHRYVDHDELQSHLSDLKSSASTKPSDPYGHPQVVGKAEKLQGGDASKAHGFSFAGKQYSASGKSGKSMHDGTPVRHFKEVTESGADNGQHVWMDHSGRVHADSQSDVSSLRGDYEAHSKKLSGPKPGHMDTASLAPGHHLFDKSGQKVDEVESVQKHPLGGLKVNTRAGYSHMVAKDGRNDHGLTNKAPGGDAKPAGSSAPVKPSGADAVKAHALKAGAKNGSGVSVFSDPGAAHSFASRALNAKGGAFVMKHDDHSHHVVVNGADAQRMEKNGYKFADGMQKSMLVINPDLLK